MPECVAEYEKRALHLHQLVLHVPGFVSSEAYFDVKNRNDRYVMVSFNSVHSWNRWHKSDARREASTEMMQMLEEPEKITILEAVIRK